MSRRVRTWCVGLAAAAIVVAANASEGGYFSQSWGWIALAFLVPVGVALILGVVEAPGPLRAAFAVLVGSLGVWIALSATWSLSSAATIREVERMLVYVAVAFAIALLVRRGDAASLAGGVFAGIVAIAGYGLATRLFQDRFDSFDDPDLSYRLSEPIGYWNAFGLVAAMGIILGLGVAAHARSLPYRVLAGTALPVLAAALFFTFSRGAWAAFAVGIGAAVAIDPRRIRLLWTMLVAAPVSVLAVVLASRQDALTTEDAPIAPALALEQGERLAVWLAGLAVLSGVLLGLGSLVARRVRPAATTRRAVHAALVVVLVVGVAAGVVSRGGPGEALSELRERFEAPLTTHTPGALNERLFNLSGTGRAEQLRVAWDMAAERPVLGNGAGTYEYFWYRDRTTTFVVRDAHSLYAEMLAEVGVIGLALLALALLVVLAAVVRGRRTPLVAASGGAFVAWAAHSSLDWNWELVGVTTCSLLSGGVGLLAATRSRRALLRDRTRVPLLALVGTLSVFAVVSVVGNQALFAGREAVERKEWARAAEHARRSERLLPWSHEPVQVAGDAAAGLGDRQGALEAYRRAVEMNPVSWVAWLRLAQVAEGEERTRAYARVHVLNPREERLPGERRRRRT